MDLFLLDDDTSSSVQALVDTSLSVARSGNFGQEDGLHQFGLGCEFAGVVESSGCWDDLATTSVDGISVQDAVHDVDSDTSHVLLAKGSLLGGPLPGGFH